MVVHDRMQELGGSMHYAEQQMHGNGASLSIGV